MTPPALPATLPPQMPQYRQNTARRFARWLVDAIGWRIVGTFPDIPRAVLIVAPHSSWWDGVIGLLVRVALGANVSFMAKRELFVGPLGWLLRRLGGVPIERDAAHGVVEQMAARFASGEGFWLGIAPEGTRKRVQRWKSGFWHIARAAGVPVLPVYFHYPERTIGIGDAFMPSHDLDADMARLRAYYAPWQGKRRGTT